MQPLSLFGKELPLFPDRSSPLRFTAEKSTMKGRLIPLMTRNPCRRASLALILCLILLLLPASAAAQSFTPLPEDAVSGPEPNHACYGTVSLDSAAEILDVIQQARASGLLAADEPVAFDPNASFYRGLYARDIEYYLDDSILAILWKEEIDGKSCSFAEIKIADASQFRRKLADDTFGSDHEYFATVMADEANAVVAMNADYYRHRNFGILAWNRELYRFNTDYYAEGYSLYNCVDTLFVTASGDFLYQRLGAENTPESIRNFMRDNDILFSVAFGPVLVENGEAIPCGWYPVGEVGMGYSRAGIGQIAPLHYLYMSLNHGSHEARWNVTQFAQHFAEKPVQTAYCLDGGQTGELVFRGEPYNYIDFGMERNVSDILWFATAIPSDVEGALLQ